MSIDCHLKLAGVEGEAVHKDHKGEIALQTWTWHVTNASSAITTGGAGQGKAVPGDFQFSGVFEKSSIVIAKNCVVGKHFDEAIVTVRKSGDGQLDFTKCTMKQVFITGMHVGATSGGEIGVTGTLAYGDIEWSYKAQDDKGKLGGEVKFGWKPGSTETR